MSAWKPDARDDETLNERVSHLPDFRAVMSLLRVVVRLRRMPQCASEGALNEASGRGAQELPRVLLSTQPRWARDLSGRVYRAGKPCI
jgi:hypothetical protein